MTTALPHIELVLERIDQGLALINRQIVHAPVVQLFEPSSYAQCKALREGRGKAFQVQGEFGLAALRHYRRGGLTGAIWQDRYPYFGAERTRCFRELRLLAKLHQLGLPVPMPLATQFVRSGLFYRADLLTSWLPGAQPLSALIQSVDADLMQQIGAMLARFHRANLCHADLNAHNVLIAETGPALIDFDRCGFLDDAPSWKEANLLRLKRSLVKLGFGARTDFESQLWQGLMSGYRNG